MIGKDAERDELSSPRPEKSDAIPTSVWGSALGGDETSREIYSQIYGQVSCFFKVLFLPVGEWLPHNTWDVRLQHPGIVRVHASYTRPSLEPTTEYEPHEGLDMPSPSLQPHRRLALAAC